MVIVAAIIVALIGGILWALIAGLPTWLLWNALMPTLFHLPRLSFWQAVGLLLLTNFLFRSGGSSSSSEEK